MNGNVVIEFRPPPATRTLGQASIDAMVFAFREHCEAGGRDFLEYLNPLQMDDVIEQVNDAANGGYTDIEALKRIRAALGEVFEIAAQGHREALEWEGVE